MNIVELLMAEHASLRLHFNFARRTDNWNGIYDVEEFVRNCHAKVEDDVVFPKLRENLLKEGSNVESSPVDSLSRLEADHLLIDKIGEQIRERTVQRNDRDILQKRVLLYATTVESHNSSEESLIFQYWKQPQAQDADSHVKQGALKIIREFGLNRYFQVTGISEKLLDLLR